MTRSGVPICRQLPRRRVLLEQISQELSWRLGASVQRRPGDGFTLGDLWPGVKKALKNTAAKPVCDEIDQLVAIRNLMGAHYNDWPDLSQLGGTAGRRDLLRQGRHVARAAFHRLARA
jgi:hypothetical protein